MRAFDGRVLLTRPSAVEFTQSTLLATIQYRAEYASLGIALAAPNMRKTDLSKLRGDLCDYLKGALNINPQWVWHVEASPDTNSTMWPTIAATPGNPELMGYECEQILRDTTRAYLTMRAKLLGLRAVVIADRQVLVPLNFQLLDTPRIRLAVTVPDDLQLAGSRGELRVINFERFNHGCDRLRQTLSTMLDARGHSGHTVNVFGNREGLKVEVTFNKRPNWLALNDIEGTVGQVLDMLTQYPSMRHELVFEPVRQHQPDDESTATHPDDH